MTHDLAQGEVREIRETSWTGLAIGGVGLFLLVVSLAVLGVLLLEPPKNPPPAPWAPYAIPTVGAVLLAIGLLLFWNSRVALRLRPREVELPRFDVAIPWSDIAEIDVVQFQWQKTGPRVPLLVMFLTPGGRRAIGNRQLTNTPHATALAPRPDVCLACNFVSYGPDIDSPLDFARDLQQRRSAATGAIDATMPLPPMDAPFALRDTTTSGPAARVYIHDTCGEGTVVSDGSLYWVTNPLRYTSGTAICSRCGEALDVTLRWEDTGETVARFRRRMWRQTSLTVKLLQFVIVPALLATVVALVVPVVVPLAPNLSPAMKASIMFGVGFVAANMLLLLTPLAGMVPALTGYTYDKYR